MTHKLESVTSNIRVGFDENSDKYVIYKVGDDFPYCYSRIASFGREVDALEWYKRVNNHETLLALVEGLVERIEYAESKSLDDICECIGAPKEYNKAKSMISDRFVSSLKESKTKATETLNKIKGE